MKMRLQMQPLPKVPLKSMQLLSWYQIFDNGGLKILERFLPWVWSSHMRNWETKEERVHHKNQEIGTISFKAEEIKATV